jgi:hypothetical protein
MMENSVWEVSSLATPGSEFEAVELPPPQAVMETIIPAIIEQETTFFHKFFLLIFSPFPIQESIYFVNPLQHLP